MRTYPPQNHLQDVPIPAPAYRAPHSGRCDYLVKIAVEASPDWVVVTNLNTRTGETAKARSRAIHGAAEVPWIKVETSHQHGFLYVRLINQEVA